MPRATRSQTRNSTSKIHAPNQIKKPATSNKRRRNQTTKKSTSDDGLPPVPLNSHCRQLFTGYFLNQTEGKFDQIYVDTKNQVFLAPETPILDFHRLFLLNRQFNLAVRTYFHYLQYHFSITSRPFDPHEFTGVNRMHYKSLESDPQPPLDKHKSVVVFSNGALLHVFKDSNFFLLKRQGLFRPSAASLTFDGSDTTNIPKKFDLFADLKSLNFHTSEDLSCAFRRILNDSFVSLKELAFYHPKFMSKLTDQVAFPPNLQTLHSAVTYLTIMDSNVHLYKQLLAVDAVHLEIGMELLVRASRLSDDPILLNGKIQQLTVLWSCWPEDIAQVLSKLSVNTPQLKVIRFKRRDLQDLQASRYGFGDGRNFVAKNTSFSFFNEPVISEDIQNMVKDEGRLFGHEFPFRIVFEQGLFLFERRRKDQVPASKYPIDIQISMQSAATIQIQLLENGRVTGPAIDLAFSANNLEENLRLAMCDLWTQFCRPGEAMQVDGDAA